MAQRLDLDAFQQQLAQRLAASGTQAQSVHWLALAHGIHHFLLPLTHAGEIFPPAPVQPLPYAKDWVRGVATLRGGLFTVLDLPRYLGLSPLDDAVPAGHFVSFSPALGLNAVWPVQQLLGLRGATDFSLAADDAAPHGPVHPAVRQRLSDTQGRLWHELDLRVLVARPDFLDIHQRGSVPAPSTH